MEKLLFNEYYGSNLYFAIRVGRVVYENELTKLKNLPVIRKEKVTIKELFRLYWDRFKKAYPGKLRQSILDNIDALIACKDLSKGYIFYDCPNCSNFHLTGFSCHSRFCTSCGKKYRDNRSLNIQKKLLDVPHRHFVFSIPEKLRVYFAHCRSLYDVLFKSVNESFNITMKLSKKDQRLGFRVGYVAFLHTSGRPLNLHPHLHVLLAERMVDKDGEHKHVHYFPFERLKKTMMYRFLANANQVLKEHGDKELYDSFNKLRTLIPRKYTKGFYIYGPANKKHKSHIKSAKDAADYISRYASHPPIAESSLISLDDFNDTITWSHRTHQNPKELVITEESVFSFIAKLIRHIPDNGFHVLRYYGFYANRASKRLEKKRKLFDKTYLLKIKTKLKWRIMIKDTYKYDPLLCYCGHVMVYNLDLSYFGKYDWRDFDG